MNLQKLSPEQKKYIAIGVLGLVLVVCIYFMVGGKKKEDRVASFEKPDIEAKKKEYESRTQQARNQRNQKRASLYDYFDESEDTTETLYSEEDDPRMMELQRQIEKMENQNQAAPTYSQHSYPSAPTGGRSIKKQDDEEAYLQSLIQGREEMLRQHQQSTRQYQSDEPVAGKEEEASETPVEFRASVYEDQYVLPGDRVKLVLQKDLVYNQKLFPKGTFIYAFASIGPSRVFLEVDNIAHIPLKLAAKDITDGRKGLYSTRAGELWLQYKDEMNNETNETLAEDIAEASNSSLVNTALKGIVNFFKKKKLRERDKILLVNNHELLLTNTMK